jgi:hypothetical protein
MFSRLRNYMQTLRKTLALSGNRDLIGSCSRRYSRFRDACVMISTNSDRQDDVSLLAVGCDVRRGSAKPLHGTIMKF